jgi:uncharacterized protein (DUF2267 family)
MESPTTDPQFLEQEEMDFLYQIKKELSLETTMDAVRLVACVLQALRQTLALEEAKAILNLLPDFLKLAFAANWESNEPRIPVEHLDEFVSLIMDRDEKSQRGLFRNEVQTLSVAILTLKNLNKIVDLENFSGISPALKQELREVSPEAAA